MKSLSVTTLRILGATDYAVQRERSIMPRKTARSSPFLVVCFMLESEKWDYFQS